MSHRCRRLRCLDEARGEAAFVQSEQPADSFDGLGIAAEHELNGEAAKRGYVQEQHVVDRVDVVDAEIAGRELGGLAPDAIAALHYVDEIFAQFAIAAAGHHDLEERDGRRLPLYLPADLERRVIALPSRARIDDAFAMLTALLGDDVLRDPDEQRRTGGEMMEERTAADACAFRDFDRGGGRVAERE